MQGQGPKVEAPVSLNSLHTITYIPDQIIVTTDDEDENSSGPRKKKKCPIQKSRTLINHRPANLIV